MIAGTGSGYGVLWVKHPPISREEAETEFGAAIPEAAWREICAAFLRHGRRLDDWKQATRLNKSPNDPNGWMRRKNDTDRRLEAAFNALGGINRDFLHEAETIVSLAKDGGMTTGNCAARLTNAMDEILFVLAVMREALPIGREMPSEAGSRRILARDIFMALEPFGARLSNGWAVAITPPSIADLTGFERLAEVLQIHQGDTPAATAKWLREAIGTK